MVMKAQSQSDARRPINSFSPTDSGSGATADRFQFAVLKHIRALTLTALSELFPRARSNIRPEMESHAGSFAGVNKFSAD